MPAFSDLYTVGARTISVVNQRKSGCFIRDVGGQNQFISVRKWTSGERDNHGRKERCSHLWERARSDKESIWCGLLEEGHEDRMYDHGFLECCEYAVVVVWWRQWQHHIFQGIIEGVKGPTILDLSNIFDTTVTAISAMFIFSATSSLVGCFLCKNFTKHNYLQYLNSSCNQHSFS